LGSEEITPDAFQKIVEKAVWLIENGRVVKISDMMFYVMGRRNRHIVKVEGDRLTCTCPGFKSKQLCSHVIAVSTILKMREGIEYLDERVRERVSRELRTLRGGDYSRV